MVNGQQAKASTNVKVGDELQVRFGQKLVTAKVEMLQESTKKEDAANMYKIIKEETLS